MKKFFSYCIKKVLFLAIFFMGTSLFLEIQAMESSEEETQLEHLPKV